MMKLISHKIFLKHDLPGHPERAERIKKALKLFPYEQAVNGDTHLTKVHTKEYVQRVKEASASAGDSIGFLDAGEETYICKDSYKAACYAVGAAVKAADYARKKTPAFALVRPPGHHAHPDWTNGFCLFNNIAIAAAYLAEKKAKVLIVDIDMHRGDGTSDCVSQLNPDLGNRLYYFSINQQGVFPGACIDEGNIRNIYVSPDITEEEYISILTKELPHVIKRFKPTVIAISAGFDSFALDKESYGSTLGCSLSLTKKTIAELKKLIQGIPYFAVLEGGYDPDSVAEGVGAFLGVKVETRKPKVEKEEAEEIEFRFEEEIGTKKVKEKASKKKSSKKSVKKRPPARKKTKKKAGKAKKAKAKKK